MPKEFERLMATKMIRCAWCGADTTHRPRIEFWLEAREQNISVCQSCTDSTDFQGRFPQDNGPVAPAKTPEEARAWRAEQREKRIRSYGQSH